MSPTAQSLPRADTSAQAPTRPRVLFVRNLFLPEDLGGNRYPFEVATRLAQRQYELTVVASHSPNVARYEHRLGGLHLCSYRAPRVHPLLTHVAHTIGAAAAISQLPRGQYDVLVASSYDVALAALALPSWRSIPRVFIYHSEFYSVWVEGMKSAASARPTRLLGNAVGGYMRWVERQVFQGASQIVAVSEFSKRQIIERAPSAAPRVQVIPTGVDTAHFVPARSRDRAKSALDLAPSQPLVLGVGRLTPVKRFDRLLAATAELRSQGLMVQLALVGDGPEAGRLRQLARDLGLAETVRFAGYQDASGVSRYMQAADLQVCSSEFENHSLAILEALASGVPVVATRSGGTPEILEQIDPDLLLPDPEPASIASTVSDLLRNPSRLEALGRRSRAIAEQRYDWEAVVSALERLLQDAAGSRSSAPS